MRHLSSFIFAALLLLSGCSKEDRNVTVTFYAKEKHKPSCMRLVVFPPDPMISTTLTQLYDFTQKCPFELQASKKTGICCNSNQNADKKALTEFPNGYIRLDLYKNHKPYYSYYKDIQGEVEKEDVVAAFKRLQEDVLK